jgi:peptidase E
MKTKFILHGGFKVGATNEDNSDFYKEILKDAPENARVLLVPFAKEPERILPTTARVSAELNNNKSQENLTIEVANEKDFIQQIDLADVVYFQGGVSLKLLEALKKYPDLANHLNGKVFAGESAGANVMCKYFYRPSADGVFEGLGILPLKICPHYKEEYKGKLDNVGPDLEELLLPEYSYRIIYK